LDKFEIGPPPPL